MAEKRDGVEKTKEDIDVSVKYEQPGIGSLTFSGRYQASRDLTIPADEQDRSICRKFLEGPKNLRKKFAELKPLKPFLIECDECLNKVPRCYFCGKRHERSEKYEGETTIRHVIFTKIVHPDCLPSPYSRHGGFMINVRLQSSGLHNVFGRDTLHYLSNEAGCGCCNDCLKLCDAMGLEIICALAGNPPCKAEPQVKKEEEANGTMIDRLLDGGFMAIILAIPVMLRLFHGSTGATPSVGKK